MVGISNYFSYPQCEKVLANLIDSIFLDGRDLQENFKINGRKLVYTLLEAKAIIALEETADIEHWDLDLPHYGEEYYIHNCELQIPYFIKKRVSESDEKAIVHQLEKILDTPIELKITTLLEDIEDDWRARTKAKLDSEIVNNQGNVKNTNMPPYVEDGLYFRSKSEISLYFALKSANVLFFPLPVAQKSHPFRREPDFLIIHKGVPAIIEVDGPEFHKDLDKDNFRDDVFRLEGIQVFKRSANQCYNKPAEVVKTIIDILEKTQSK